MNDLQLMLARSEAAERERDLQRRLARRRHATALDAASRARRKGSWDRALALFQGRLARAQH